MWNRATLQGMSWSTLLALLLWGLQSLSADLSRLAAGSGVGTQCESQACNPPMGNLALGRRIQTRTVCGSNYTESFCSYTGPAAAVGSCPPLKCDKCSSAQPQHAHPASAMADSSFRHPDTWWQSAEGVSDEFVQLDLETKFYLTHLIVVFRSVRPAAMVLERSQDFTHNWTTLAYFARNCTEAFGLEDRTLKPDEVECTSKYSAPFPCTRGEVIYRALPPWNSLDPYSEKAQHKLLVTNLRLRLLLSQECPCGAKEPAAGPRPGGHFAIYDFIAKGSCFCNGHAEHCGPAPGYQPLRERTNHVVHGKCICRHNTAGDHCERCAPLYNDQPWQPANGITGAPKECKKCKCNGHAAACRFSRTVWLTSGRRSGGVCIDCQHNTEGRNCQSCKSGFYRDPQRPASAPDSCKPCACHPMGSVHYQQSGGTFCNPRNGHCICKPGVGGPHCDRCMVGYWGFLQFGCKACACDGDCDPFTGDCVFGPLSLDLEHDLSPRHNSSEGRSIFRTDELFSALHYSEKCECKEQVLSTPKRFCSMKYAFVLKVKILSAHDKGSHAEVEVKVKKILTQNTKVKLPRGRLTLYPESWTARGCTCPVLNPGTEYLVTGYEEQRKGRLVVNMKSFVKPWTASLGRKVLQFLNMDCKR
ncbi:netrin-4 [Brienomyrus brachyistius]|uniref:netrin-4 n=1 Tax=Brienomyrus brachyistius TaxID=42636 RepID=UPI0020B2F6F7|nr:netrin-4 [Brienomyrus brachyistius]